MTADTIKSTLRGPEKWLAAAEARKKQKSEQKIKTGLLIRKTGLNDLTIRSQYFVDKYPLIEKTRGEREKIIEERNVLELRQRLIAAR